MAVSFFSELDMYMGYCKGIPMLSDEENAMLLTIAPKVNAHFPAAQHAEVAKGVCIFWQGHTTAPQVLASVKLLLAHFKSLCATTLRRTPGGGSNNIDALQQAVLKPTGECDVHEQKLRLILVIKELLTSIMSDDPAI